jgi:uncharacterized protein
MPAKQSNRELRRVGIAPKVATREGKTDVIQGYGAVYYDPADEGSEYRLWSDMAERIRPGAFDRAVREDDVRGLFNHESSEILGRTTNNTLVLSVDSKGLRYEITPPDTQAGRDAVTLLRRGDVDGSSFQFEPLRVTWEEQKRADGSMVYIRWLEDVKLYDVGPVTFPAYQSATSGVRSEDREQSIRDELAAWKRKDCDQAAADQDLIATTAMKMQILEAPG